MSLLGGTNFSTVRGCGRFMFAHADIEITPAAIDTAAQDPCDRFVLARTDFDLPLTGEPVWDNVGATIRAELGRILRAARVVKGRIRYARRRPRS